MSRQDKQGIIDKVTRWLDDLATKAERADFTTEALWKKKEIMNKQITFFKKERLGILEQQHTAGTAILLDEFKKDASQLLSESADALKQKDLDRLRKEDNWAVPGHSSSRSSCCFFPEVEEKKTESEATPYPASRV